MVWIILLVVVILLLRNISLSHKSASIPMTCKAAPVHGSTPTAGDSFCSGRSFTAGVSEPASKAPPLSHPVCYGPVPSLPVHVTFPAVQPPLPPPLRIIQPQPIRAGVFTGGGEVNPLPVTRRYTL